MTQQTVSLYRGRWLGSAVAALLMTSGLWLAGCTATTADPPTPLPSPTATVTLTAAIPTAQPPAPPTDSQILADVVSVDVSGDLHAYTFTIGVSSPDTGCEQYADWWEIITEEGDLLYRRILLHSHVGEQPFVRSGGPVPIPGDLTVIVRAHMVPGGYGGHAMKGTVNTGFEPALTEPDFAADLADVDPLPESCAF